MSTNWFTEKTQKIWNWNAVTVQVNETKWFVQKQTDLAELFFMGVCHDI